MWKSVSALLLLTLLVGVETAEAGKKRTGPGLRYLRPVAFEELPGSIVRSLESRKCMIPQYPKAWTATDRINVVRGEFAKAGQNDWAVICADATDETLLVFWNSSDKDPGEFSLGFAGYIPGERQGSQGDDCTELRRADERRHPRP